MSTRTVGGEATASRARLAIVGGLLWSLLAAAAALLSISSGAAPEIVQITLGCLGLAWAGGVAVLWATARRIVQGDRVRELGERRLVDECRFLGVVLENLSDGVVACDRSGRITFVNDGAREMLRLRSDPPTLAELFKSGLQSEEGTPLSDPAESPFMVAMERGRLVRQSLRLSAGDEVRDLMVGADALLDREGRCQGAVATLSDVTDKRRAESELRLAATAFETHEGIMITDANSVIERVNRGFCEITGYRADEVIGETPAILQSGRHDEAFFREIWETLGRAGHWSGVIWNRRKSGEIFPQRLSITAVRDGQGRVTRYVGTFLETAAQPGAEIDRDYLAFHDSLTGLPNRALLADRLNRAVARMARRAGFGAALHIDLDHFGNVNESLGHPTGDLLLKQVAARLKEIVRSDDTLARLRGDEFMIVLHETGTGLEEATSNSMRVAEKIRVRLEEPYRIHDYELYVTPSVGLTLFSGADRTVEEILGHAEAAMQKAKERGRNRVSIYQPQLQGRVADRLTLEADLRQALDKDQLILFYQPQVELATGRLVGAEGLVRWRHPRRGLIAPAEFMPIAEEIGIASAIDDWVLREACCRNRIWQQARLPRIPLAVNLSAGQFRQPGLLDGIGRILAETGLAAEYLELEISESALMADAPLAIATLRKLRHLGLRLAVDDFGTGYSSVGQLGHLPVEKLKIDRSLVRALPGDPASATTARAIVALAHALDLRALAEGVENAAQVAFLSRIGCDEAQGFYYGPPASLDAFSTVISDWGRRIARVHARQRGTGPAQARS